MDQLVASHGVDGLLKCLLSLGHLVGLALGLGTTAFLDGGCILSIVSRSWGRYRAFMSGSLFHCATNFVLVGLALLWLTGIGFLLHYAAFAPEKLANPKIYAKLVLVTVLTANGALLHYSVLPRVAAMDDPHVLLSTTAGRFCAFCGAVSGASWIGAFLLGALPILNYVVGVEILLAAWAVLVLAMLGCVRALLATHARRSGLRGPATIRGGLA